jgi:uncharacterized membrane protein YvbJ
MAAKKPRFFCDNCGAEVPLNARNCPGCGRFFTSVRCPKCGFSDDEGSFKNGCPSCGYSMPPSDNKKSPQKYDNTTDSLPIWVYILTAAAFTGVLAALFFTYF